LTKQESAAGPKNQHKSEIAAAGGFSCRYCHALVAVPPSGTKHRNHCPHCLWSLHVEVERGDRGAGCGGLMEPVGVWVKTNREWSLFHRCERCGHFSVNRIAGDDTQVALLSLALRPLAFPPFPLTEVAAEFVSHFEADQEEAVPLAAGTRGSRYLSGLQRRQASGFLRESGRNSAVNSVLKRP
jgi:hypothetical protein